MKLADLDNHLGFLTWMMMIPGVVSGLEEGLGRRQPPCYYVGTHNTVNSKHISSMMLFVISILCA